MDFFEGIDEDPDNELQAEVREKLERQRKAAAAATEAKNEETKPIGAGAYLAKMAAKTATGKKESAAKDLVKTALKKKNEKISIEPVVGDEIAAMIPLNMPSKEGGDNTMKNIMGLASLAMKAHGLFAKGGGRLNPKAEKSKKAKKRYVRGVGAAKRGYGKATYSKKMY